jgi:hypothetical protein
MVEEYPDEISSIDLTNLENKNKLIRKLLNFIAMEINYVKSF